MIDLFKEIPEELKLNALWCCWKYIINKNGDNIKMPFNPLSGYGAKSNDKSTFVTYPTAMRYANNYIAYDGKKQIGGIGLGIFNGYSAIDIDHCVSENGKISDMAKEIIDFCQSYTEFSPSGTGIRIIFKSKIFIDKNKYYINNSKKGLEIYISDNTNKFVTITGNKISGDEIKEIDLITITPEIKQFLYDNGHRTVDSKPKFTK
jgi:primase-polymerase (primpol)-like protein